MNATTELLRLLGSPFVKKTSLILERAKVVELCSYSKNNRILLFYLEKIIKNNSHLFSTLHQKENVRYWTTLDAIAKASQALTDSRIPYVVFKTIRPYKSATVDIDILIFGEKNNYVKAVDEMRRVGYKLVVRGPRSTTLLDQKANIGIDLYEQVAAGFIIYVDKQTLKPHISNTIMENGICVSVPDCEADLLCLIAHSMIKEQMYTLSEYFTFIYYLKKLNIEDFLKLVKQNNLSCATRTHATITALLHKVAHGTVPEKLQEILFSLGEDKFEAARIIEKNLVTPHKYHPITIAKSLLEITKGKETRESIATQLFHMFNPKFSKDFTKKLINHILRETY
jgi:hypothetical protein